MKNSAIDITGMSRGAALQCVCGDLDAELAQGEERSIAILLDHGATAVEIATWRRNWRVEAERWRDERLCEFVRWLDKALH